MAIIVYQYPSVQANELLSFLFSHPPAARNLALSPIFFSGFVLLVCGAAIRAACYNTLGKYFTFELALLKDHQLVTTGPYAIVRHPSYTGFIIAAFGVLTVSFLPGSYAYESGMLNTWKVVPITIWVSFVFYFLGVLIRRIPQEDRALREEFGSQWDLWAQKTPYKLVPYLY